MTAKITVNGVTYDSVDAMPPDVRRIYDQTMAKFPELADRDGDGMPDLVRLEGLAVRRGVTVRKKIVVNGVTYEDKSAMPPDVRQAYERAMSAMVTAGPTVQRNDIKLSFQVTGPGFSFRTGSGAQSPSPAADPAAGPASMPLSGARNPLMRPIEPAAGPGLRVALFVVAAVAGGLVLWLLTRAH